MIWEGRRWWWAVGNAGALQRIRPKLTAAQIRLPKAAVTVLLKLLSLRTSC
jgi:hypothetical protein